MHQIGYRNYVSERKKYEDVLELSKDSSLRIVGNFLSLPPFIGNASSFYLNENLQNSQQI